MPTPERLNGWMPRLAIGLAIAGIVAGISAWGQQQGMARDVDANGKAAKLCCDKAYANENELTGVVTELRLLNETIKRDRNENRAAHKAIMDKLDDIDGGR